MAKILNERELADEINLVFEAGADHVKTCTRHSHRKMDDDGALLFYGAILSGLLIGGNYSKDFLDKAVVLSLDEMKKKYDF